MPNPSPLVDIQREIEKEKARIAELSQKEVRGVSHLGLQKKSVLPISGPSDLQSISSKGSGDNEAEALDESPDAAVGEVTASDAAKVIRPIAPPVKTIPPKQQPQPIVPLKLGANLPDERFGPLRDVLKNAGPSRPITAPPPVALIVAEKYGPGIEQVENAFDALEAWAVSVKNWKLWTLLMDQYGLGNSFPMPPAPVLEPPIDHHPALHRALTQQQTSKLGPCPLLKCKQSMFHEEVHKVIKPWCKTNFSTALMELGDTLCLLLEKIPRGIKEHEPPAELLQFIAEPNAASKVYNGTSPVFNYELSRQLTEKIRTETLASKRLFMDSDLLQLKHQTDTNLRTLAPLHTQCNAKSPHGNKLDDIFNVYRAIEWQNATHSAYDALNRSFDGVKWTH